MEYRELFFQWKLWRSIHFYKIDIYWSFLLWKNICFKKNVVFFSWYSYKSMFEDSYKQWAFSTLYVCLFPTLYLSVFLLLYCRASLFMNALILIYVHCLGYLVTIYHLNYLLCLPLRRSQDSTLTYFCLDSIVARRVLHSSWFKTSGN